ncbi:MAG: hypothetical protein HYZ72_13685 [Deltaproteobacteria bacterium]|nr:hypothetical protein [Deltaproteobacteria bacterium]
MPNSSLIEVAYTDTDPQWAAAVVNTVLDAYPTYQVNLYHNPSSLSFYDGQKEMLAREITEAEEKLKTFQTQENLFSLAQQKDQGLDLIQKVKERMQATDADMNQGKGKIAEIERQLTSQPERILTAQEVIDPETRMLHEKLVALEVEKNALLQKYTEKDRRVEDKMQEIETLRERLAADAGKKKVVVGERLGLNEVRQYLVRELVEQKVKLGQSQAKGEKLIRQQEELTAELEALNAKGYELQHLEEALKYKKDLYELYSKKAEEARIATAMDREKLVNVKVVDHAPVPATPVATRVSLALLLAVIAGLGTGVGGALALEYVRPTFHSAPDVERHLELPVLALIPDLRQQA